MKFSSSFALKNNTKQLNQREVYFHLDILLMWILHTISLLFDKFGDSLAIADCFCHLFSTDIEKCMR